MPELPPAQPPPPEEETQPDYVGRISRFAQHPLGKITAATAAVLAPSSSNPQPGESFHLAVNEYSAPSVEVVTPDNSHTQLTFGDWRQAYAFTQRPSEPIVPNDFLTQLISASEPTTQKIGLAPPKIEHPTEFSSWVTSQAERSELLAAAGITPGSELTPKQLVDLAAFIVIANIDYDYDPVYLEGGASATYRLPMDKNLIEGHKMQCEGYAVATIAVFNEIKKVHPDVLQNTFMIPESGIEEGHVWDLVIQLESPSKASVAFVDPAGEDPTYREGTEAKLGFLELVEGLLHKGVIDGETFAYLVQEYAKRVPLTDQEKIDIAQDLGSYARDRNDDMIDVDVG